MRVRYKYNFWRVLGEQYPGPENLACIQCKLREEAELTQEQLREYLNIKEHDTKDVPAKFLLIFAARFGVDVKDLVNYTLPQQTFASGAAEVPVALRKLGIVIKN